MSHLLKRPRLVVAAGLALALLLALATAVVATSFVYGGHAVKAVEVATDDATASTSTSDWSDVPSMVATMSVPANTQALFLITFSAQSYCSAVNSCDIRALINGKVVAPGPVAFGTTDVNTNSMQFLASPLPAGTYTIKVQFNTICKGCNTFYLHHRTLSVLRSAV